jgi:hypothetical protein
MLCWAVQVVKKLVQHYHKIGAIVEAVGVLEHHLSSWPQMTDLTHINMLAELYMGQVGKTGGEGGGRGRRGRVWGGGGRGGVERVGMERGWRGSPLHQSSPPVLSTSPLHPKLGLGEED